MWATDSGHPVDTPLTGNNGYVSAVVFSPAGRLLASDDQTVQLWSVR
ncbi:WD40 repeat protein [Streptacidiphilus sp. MAP12-16]